MDCPDCAAKLEKKLKALPGVQGVVLNFGAAKVAVQHSVPVAEVINAVEEAGYGAKPEGTAGDKRDTAFWQVHRRAVITSISGVALALGWILSAVGVAGPAVTGLYLAAMVVGGGFTARRAYFSVRSLVLDMNVLMTVAVAGAALIGEWFEGATVACLYSVSNAMEYYSMEKTRRSIRSLMELAPKEALVRRNGSELRMPVEEVRVGDAIVVRPGEKIPMDGVVTGGRSSVNQAPITGESMPVEKSEGDEVYAGTINQQGSLEITVTKLVADTTLSKIIHLVEEAQAQRAPSQRFVDRFAKYYTPAVIALAAGFVLVPPLFFGQQWAPWVYRGLALLVVSCPCALVISTPVSIVSGIGNAARNGVLIKGGAYLEDAGALSVVTFDKTGTLTKGRPEVTDIIPFNGASREEVLSLAAAVETRSEHPLAEAIVRKARELGLAIKEAGNFESITGKGARAEVAGQACYIGSPRLFDDLGIQLRDVGEQLARLQEQGKTVMILGAGETVTGLIAVADQVRETGKAAIRKLREAGIKKVVMLTGDNEGTARAIAAELGLDEYRAELLPQDKVAAVKSLLDKYGKVAMVGDGINDAPALATATVGIAMGVAGTDTALETADIALMADDLSKLSYAMKLSRATLRTIKQNIAFSLVIKLAAVLLVFPGWLTLLVAILADMGASLIVTLNGMRLIGMKPEQ
ncbi:cadmium transporter [Clostridiales bacterium PH28_bin88]|nr:cadmium transporter [Clostridiales bacterium PH28_bin88]